MSHKTPSASTVAFGRVREDEPRPPKKQYPPGVIHLRIVIVLLCCMALMFGWSMLVSLTTGVINLVALLVFALSLIAAIGLLVRVNGGRVAGIAVLWLVFALNALGLILVLARLLGVAAGTIELPETGSIGWAVAWSILNIALCIWMLSVLHSRKTNALMEKSLALVARAVHQEH